MIACVRIPAKLRMNTTAATAPMTMFFDLSGNIDRMLTSITMAIDVSIIRERLNK